MLLQLGVPLVDSESADWKWLLAALRWNQAGSACSGLLKKLSWPSLPLSSSGFSPVHHVQVIKLPCR